MIKLISALENNDLITVCEGDWGSLLLLAAKPREESCTNIYAFIWKLCVGYRALNSITLGFEITIPRCTNIIENLVDSSGLLSIISLDARSDYHQIRVRESDQKKLFSHSVEQRKRIKFFLSVLQILKHFTIP